MRVTGHDYEWTPKFFAVLTGLFCGAYIVVAVMNLKMLDVLGLVIPGGLLLFPVCCILSDVLTEIYGFNRTRQAVWTGMACLILYSLMTQLAIFLKPASFWPHQEAFAALLDTSWRIGLAGCLAWVAGEFSNSWIMSRMKIWQNARGMPTRFIGSTVVGQFFDTLVFVSVAFAGTMPWGTWGQVLLVSWLFKVGYEVVALPVSIPVACWIKRLEGIEHFDRQKISLV